MKRYFGNNSGYIGYSQSVRAAQAKEEGRYPKTEFKRVYKVTPKSFDVLVNASIIGITEWHHTSMYGNRTDFYGWEEPYYADVYENNKKEIDKLARARDYDAIETIFENSEEVKAYEEKIKAEQERIRVEIEEDRKRNELIDEYKKSRVVPEEIITSNGVIVRTYGKEFSDYWEAEKDGIRLTKRHKKDLRNAAFDETREKIKSLNLTFEEWLKENNKNSVV